MDIEDLEDNCRLRRATFIKYKEAIDLEDFAEDVPDVAVIKVKVKVG